MPGAGIITVGDELLEGRIVDQHSAVFSEAMTRLGIPVHFLLSVGDRPGALAGVLGNLPVEVDHLVIVGGMGPTEDDRTRFEVANALGIDLQHREEAWQRILSFFQQRGVEPTESNRKQSLFPVGSTELPNERGTAPGIHVEVETGGVWMLPGVPSEFRWMLERYLVPALDSGSKGDEREVLDFYGISESRLDHWLVEALGEETDDYHICVRGWGQIEVRLPVGVSLAGRAKERFQGRMIGEGGHPVEVHLVTEALAAQQTLTTAESCTGGGLAERITTVVGSSGVYSGGWVVYSDDSKSRELGVDPQLLARHGAVSQECVLAMVDGALARSGDSLAVAISGIAGPGGGSAEKPVGTIDLALGDADGGRWTRRLTLGDDRQRNRSISATEALAALLSRIRGEVPFRWTPIS